MTVENIINKYSVDHYYTDMDGVLINTVESMCQVLDEIFNTHIEPCMIRSWNFSEYDSSLTDKDIEWLFNSKRLFDKIKFYDGAKEFLLSHENDTSIVTKGGDINLKFKQDLLYCNGLEGVEFIGLGLDESKSIVDMSNGLFIDDCTFNLNEVNAKVKVQFRRYDNDAEWQRGWNGIIVDRWR